MNTATRRQKRTVGDVVTIDLGDGTHTYARVIPEATFAFYDCRRTERPDVREILASPILFQLAVMDYAVKKGHWKVIGNEPLESTLQKPLPKFIQDALKPTQFSIYEDGKIRPAEKSECVGLERAAVWDPSHVEDRLRDHYAGRKNKWVDSLKLTATRG